MEWSDCGIVIYKKTLQESSALLELLTLDHGRVRGFLHESRRANLGDIVHGNWKGKSEDQLGFWRIEPISQNSQIDDYARSIAILSLCQLCHDLMPENHTYPALFQIAHHFLTCEKDWRKTYVEFELALLANLGFGLSISRCAITGQSENLTHISVETGCAFSENAYKTNRIHQLVSLPSFMTEAPMPDITPQMYKQANQLIGYFISKNLYQNKALPLHRTLLAA